MDQVLAARGREVYAARCATCHGSQGEGGAAWQQLDERGELPPPPHNAEGHTWRHADGMLYRIIREGWRDPFNRTDRLTMPPFSAVLSPEEIRAVVTYLKTWWEPDQRRFQREESHTDPFPPDTVR